MVVRATDLFAVLREDAEERSCTLAQALKVHCDVLSDLVTPDKVTLRPEDMRGFYLGQHVRLVKSLRAVMEARAGGSMWQSSAMQAMTGFASIMYEGGLSWAHGPGRRRRHEELLQALGINLEEQAASGSGWIEMTKKVTVYNDPDAAVPPQGLPDYGGSHWLKCEGGAYFGHPGVC